MNPFEVFLLVLFSIITGFSIGYVFNQYKRISIQRLQKPYEDYVNKDKQMILRIFRPEFEADALEKIPVNNILEGGTLNSAFRWVLFYY